MSEVDSQTFESDCDPSLKWHQKFARYAALGALGAARPFLGGSAYEAEAFCRIVRRPYLLRQQQPAGQAHTAPSLAWTCSAGSSFRGGGPSSMSVAPRFSSCPPASSA